MATWTPPEDAIEVPVGWTPPTDAVEVTAAPAATPMQSFGMGTRSVLEGLGGLPQLIGMPMEAMGLKGAGTNLGTSVADLFGLSKPQTSAEKMRGAITSGVAGSLPFLGAGAALNAGRFTPEIAKQLGKVMVTAPATQAAMGGVSGGASEAAAQGGLGPVGQTVAGLVAPFAAAGAGGAAAHLARVGKNIVAPMVSQNAADRGAAVLAVKAAGPRAAQIAEALKNAKPEETAGMVGAAIGNADIPALQAIANKNNATLADTIKTGVEARLGAVKKNIETALAPVRNESIALANAGGVDVQPIINRLDAYRNASGNKVDDVAQAVTSELRQKLAALAEAGPVDAAELHTMRKQLNDSIGKYTTATSSWDKKKSASFQIVMKEAIDDAIDKAIGRYDPSKEGIWKNNYMKPYDEGYKGVRQVEDTLVKEGELANKGMAAVRKAINESDIKAPGLLNRSIVVLNAALRAVEGSAGNKVQKALGGMMAPTAYGGDKAKLGKLMTQVIEQKPGMFRSLAYKPGPSRTDLGYGIDEMVPPDPMVYPRPYTP